jgi:hypothetical protein
MVGEKGKTETRSHKEPYDNTKKSNESVYLPECRAGQRLVIGRLFYVSPGIEPCFENETSIMAMLRMLIENGFYLVEV